MDFCKRSGQRWRGFESLSAGGPRSRASVALGHRWDGVCAGIACELCYLAARLTTVGEQCEKYEAVANEIEVVVEEI